MVSASVTQPNPQQFKTEQSTPADEQTVISLFFFGNTHFSDLLHHPQMHAADKWNVVGKGK